MAEVGSGHEICSDRNFQRLAASETGAEEFKRLLATHVAGYNPKKRVVDGLKDLLTRVETAENKLYLAKNLGKARSKLEGEEQALADRNSSLDLKEKIQTLNNDVQAMIDEGRLTFEEKPQVHEQLLARRERAKAAGKDKVVEKVENMLSSVSKAEPVVWPISDLDTIYPVYMELKEILRLEKRPQKSLGGHERHMLNKKSEIEEAVRKWSEKNRMWFETESEFHPRLEKGVEALTKLKAEQRKREEEEALERKRLAEEQALEQKRLEKQEAEERKAKELETRLEVKRLQAALKPQKEAPAAKKREKVKRTMLNPHSLFQPPPRGADDEDQPELDEAPADHHEDPEEDEEVAHEEANEEVKASAPTAAADAKAAAPASADAKASAPVKAASDTKKASEGIWESPGAAREVQDGDEDAGPSLAAAAKEKPVVKKTPPPAPKKKEKKKFTKLSASDLGFDANNPNYLN